MKQQRRNRVRVFLKSVTIVFILAAVLELQLISSVVFLMTLTAKKLLLRIKMTLITGTEKLFQEP